MDSLRQSYNSVKKDIGPKTLVAVSKYSPKGDIEALYELGHRDFGENRVADLEVKAKELTHLDSIRWHFIGNIQTNKLAKLLKVDNLFSIHSIDSLNLIDKLIDKLRRRKRENLLRVFLQINTSGESEKSGLEDIEEIDQAARSLIQASENGLLKFEGLMTMGTLRTEDREQAARKCFQNLVEIRDSLNKKYELDLKLSMGMSSDYLIALENSSDYVRVGSKIFR